MLQSVTICFFYSDCGVWGSDFLLVSEYFTFNRQAKVPWNTVSQDPSEFLAEDSLPNGVELVVPSKLKAAGVELLLSYWLQQQEEGVCGLVFQRALNNDKMDHNALLRGGR